MGKAIQSFTENDDEYVHMWLTEKSVIP